MVTSEVTPDNADDGDYGNGMNDCERRDVGAEGVKPKMVLVADIFVEVESVPASSALSLS